MVNNFRGISNIGCLFLLALIVGCFFIGYKFAVVQWNIETFKEEMTEVTRYFANDKGETTQTIKTEIIRRAQQCGFDIAPEEIAVNYETAYLAISVSWLEPIVFPGGYIYQRPVVITRRIKKFGY